MVKNEKTITINRPIEEVFAYVSDLQNGPEWQNGLVEARRITEGPLGVGTKFTDVRKFPGGKLESVVQCTTYEPNKKVVFKTITGSWPFEDTWIFESTAEGTRLTDRLDLHTSGWMRLVVPLVASGLRRDMDANIGILKNMLESKVAPASS
jgi:uncharacterized protein YndB with AHSA1/START domain